MPTTTKKKTRATTPTTAGKSLKLYVWENAFGDHTHGAAWALAYSVVQARQLIANKYVIRQAQLKELRGRPTVRHSPVGYMISGGE